MQADEKVKEEKFHRTLRSIDASVYAAALIATLLH